MMSKMTRLVLAAVLVAAIGAVVGGQPTATTSVQDYPSDADYLGENDRDADYPDLDEDQLLSARPNFTVVSQHLRVRKGETVRLPCEVDDVGTFTVFLKRKDTGTTIFAGSVFIKEMFPRYSRTDNSIVIDKVDAADQGTYICQVSTADNMQLEHTLDVIVPAEVVPVPASGLIVVRKGEPVTLSCNVTGNPEPVTTWTREGGRKFHDGQKSVHGNEITFTEVNRHHAGLYECSAENGEGEPAKGLINLQITYEPEIEVEMTMIHAKEGQNFELTCTVHGEPKPMVVWLKDNEHTPNYNQSSTHSHHYLHIEDIQVEDFGTYACVAENSFGKQNKTIEVTGLAKQATLKRKKSLLNGVELEWVTVSLYPVIEYRLKYHPRSAQMDSAWELILKAHPEGETGSIYHHVQQLHDLDSGTEYRLTIESMNKFGWSDPLEEEFMTLPAEVSIPEAGKVSDSKTGGAASSAAATATLAMTFVVASMLC